MKYIENPLVNLFTLESHTQTEKLKIEYGIKLIVSPCSWQTSTSFCLQGSGIAPYSSYAYRAHHKKMQQITVYLLH